MRSTRNLVYVGQHMMNRHSYENFMARAQFKNHHHHHHPD